MKKGIVVLLCLLCMCSCANPVKDKLKKTIKQLVAAAYFEGQRDALEGDIRIAKSNGLYHWVKSPFDDDPTLPLVTDGDSLKHMQKL